jgi:hypothetical protein
MCRWLAVLLLVLLPLQFSWAAVANYCGHEAGGGDHVGHHDHAAHNHGGKVAEPSDKGKTDGTSSPASSFDCGHCHGYCLGMIDVVSSLQPQMLGSAPPGPSDHTLAEHLPAQPERPNWTPFA